MKFKKINFKRLSTFILSGVILVSSGCSPQKNKTNNYKEESNYKASSRVIEEESIIEESSSGSIDESSYDYSSISSQWSEETRDSFAEISKIESDEVIETNSIEERDENSVIDYLESIDNKLNEKANIVKEELVEDYHIVYDFIFNNGTIKGYTFDELKTNAKAKVVSIYLSIDEKIDSKFPGYKETIKEKYGNAKDKIKNKLSEFKEEIIDYIGEDKYNSYMDTRDKYIEGFKEQTKNDISEVKDLAGKAWEYIKNR